MNVQQNIKQLPKGWKWVKVSSVAELYRGINYTKDVASNIPSKDNLPILRGNNINGELNYEDLVYVPKELIKPEQLIKKDDIIFAMSSGSKHLVGKSAVAKSNFKGSYGAFCAMLRVSDNVSKQYVSYIFKGNSYRKLISEIAKGTNINNLKREHILDFEIPLPPKPTQQAIVSKIEELFSELDKGIENLRTAQQQLKTYRQSVLKWAFEGKLTNENVMEGELPKGWKIKTIGDIFEVYIGSTPKRNTPEYWGGSIHWVSSGEIAFCNITDTKEKITNVGLEKTSCKVHPRGTVIIAMIGEGKTRGQAAILKIEASHNQNTAAIRVDNNIYKSELLYYYLFLKYEDNRKVGSGNNQKALNKERVKSIRIPLPPIEEQHKIVQSIESRLSVADKMEESITQSLQQAEALRQSILKKAFEGRLV